MASAQRHCELIADLATECPALGKAQVMWIRGLATAHQARLLGNVAKVIAIAKRGFQVGVGLLT